MCNFQRCFHDRYLESISFAMYKELNSNVINCVSGPVLYLLLDLHFLVIMQLLLYMYWTILVSLGDGCLWAFCAENDINIRSMDLMQKGNSCSFDTSRPEQKLSEIVITFIFDAVQAWCLCLYLCLVFQCSACGTVTLWWHSVIGYILLRLVWIMYPSLNCLC